MQKSSLRGLGVILLSFVVVLTSCGDAPPQDEARDLDLILSWRPGAEHAFIYRALRENAFQDAGIDLQVTGSRGSKDVVEALDSGDADIGFVAGDYIITARHQGIPIRALGALYQDTPGNVFTVDMSQLEHPRDLIGHRVGVLLQSASYQQYLLMLKNTGVDTAAITHIPAMNGGISQLRDGSIDALMHYTNYGPTSFQAAGHETKEILFKDYGVEMYASTIATTDGFLDDNEELLEDFFDVFWAQLRASKDNFDGTLNAILKSFPELDSAQQHLSLERTNSLIFNDTLPLGNMTRIGWEQAQQTALDAELISDPIDVQYFYDTSFLPDGQ